MSNAFEYIMMISPYTPTTSKLSEYATALLEGFDKKFSAPFKLNVCAVSTENHTYENYKEVRYVLNPFKRQEYFNLADNINNDDQISVVFIQHDFNLYGIENGENLLLLLYSIKKPIMIFLNEVPEKIEFRCKEQLKNIISRTKAVIVNNLQNKEHLINYYEVDSNKIEVLNEKLPFDESSIELTAPDITSISSDKIILTYANLFLKYIKNTDIKFNLPEISLKAVKKNESRKSYKISSTPVDLLLQSSEIIHSLCLYYKATGLVYSLNLIEIHLLKIFDIICDYNDFIKSNKRLSEKEERNIAVCFSSLAVLLTLKEEQIPDNLYIQAKTTYNKILELSAYFNDLSAQAGLIKGFYLYNDLFPNENIKERAITIADKLIERYYRNAEVEEEKEWTENFCNTPNSKLSEALLYSYLLSGVEIYKVIAIVTFDWLIANLFRNGYLSCVSNATGFSNSIFGCKPSEITETIITFHLFNEVFHDELYSRYLKIAFSWFNGNNNIKTAIYYHDLDICFDGIAGQEITPSYSDLSAINYLISRLVYEINSQKKDKVEPITKRKNKMENIYGEK